jgi:hypothetical protein
LTQVKHDSFFLTFYFRSCPVGGGERQAEQRTEAPAEKGPGNRGLPRGGFDGQGYLVPKIAGGRVVSPVALGKSTAR